MDAIAVVAHQNDCSLVQSSRGLQENRLNSGLVPNDRLTSKRRKKLRRRSSRDSRKLPSPWVRSVMKLKLK